MFLRQPIFTLSESRFPYMPLVRSLRYSVLQCIVTVRDYVDVLAKQRRALGDDGDILFLRGLHHLLALIAARLVVVLDRVRALDLQAMNVGARFKSGRASCRERVCQYV